VTVEQAIAREIPARTERYVRAGLSRTSFGMTVSCAEGVNKQQASSNQQPKRFPSRLSDSSNFQTLNFQTLNRPATSIPACSCQNIRAGSNELTLPPLPVLHPVFILFLTVAQHILNIIHFGRIFYRLPVKLLIQRIVSL